MVKYDRLNVGPSGRVRGRADPALNWLRPLIKIGAVLGLGSVVLVMLLGQSRRVLLDVARRADRRLGRQGPSRASGRPTSRPSTSASSPPSSPAPSRSSSWASWSTSARCWPSCSCAPACGSCAKTPPGSRAPFRTPLVPLVPILGILACFGLMATLPGDTWIRLFVWLAHRLRHLLRLRPQAQRAAA